jgi:formate hydrogenlyase subunit 3/multisubunit Na+/H+ antiporter MnhD subunit
MYGRKPKNEIKIKEPVRLLIPVFILAGTLIVLGLFPQIVLSLVEPVIKQLPFIP